jgi:hypothetical protein
MALFALGKAEKGREMLDILNPMGYYSDKNLAEKYKAEPYVLAGDVYGAPEISPRGGWTHFTGSAAWFYRCVAENYSDYISLSGDDFENDKLNICKVFDIYNPPKNNKK